MILKFNKNKSLINTEIKQISIF